jgi:hypothetical protein
MCAARLPLVPGPGLSLARAFNLSVLTVLTVGAAGAQDAPALAAAETAPVAPSFTVGRASSPVAIDGVLDEPAWASATAIPVAFEWFPGDNAAPPVSTEALVAYDDRHVYVGFRCHDPRPQEIRAHLMDRDSIDTFVQDDHVTLLLDPFNDQRRAFQFRVNPLGVQADALFSQVEFVEDFSWDIIWASAGRIGPDGYVVEIAIPLNQIRFPRSAPGEAQTWGLEAGRSYPRSVRHRMSANPRNRNEACLLCQVNKVTGFADLEPGLNLELDPTVTVDRTDQRAGFPAGELESGDEDYDAGLSLRWGITPNLALNAALNPDFSQVEADAAQLEVNERFALFFPEKRPFFLEGVDFFTTPIDAVFTRTVVDPEWGLKLTGKQGHNAGGVFVTRDRHTSLTLPSNQSSGFAFLEDAAVTGAVARYRRDVGSSSTLGVLYAGREGDDYHNRVGGLDGYFRLSPTDELRFQALRSETLYPGELGAPGEPTGAFAGEAFALRYQHASRDWFWSVDYDDLDPEFRADSGFVPRVDVRTLEGNLTRIVRGERDDWFTQINLGGNLARTEDHSGELTDQTLSLVGTVQGPLQSTVQVTAARVEQRFGGVLQEDLDRVDLFVQMQPSGAVRWSLFARAGETVAFAVNQEADLLLLQPAVELKLGRHLNAQASHVRQELEVDAGRLSTADLSQLRLVYNFDTRAFVRALFQYLDLEQNPSLLPVPEQTETLFTQLLFSYKLNPQTVLFLGYSDNSLGLDALSLTRTDRSFFFKIGYAFVL